MAFVGTDIEANARRILNDEDGASERYSDADILAWCQEFIRLIWNKNSASRYDAAGDLLTFANITALANTVVFIDDKWQDAIVQGVVTRCLEQEGDDTDDLTRAKAHASQFTVLTGIALVLRTR